MKTIYIIFSEGKAGECQIVFNDKLKVMDGWSCNDATWRGEYFNGLLEDFGVKVKSSHPSLTDKVVEKAALKHFGL